MFLILVVGLCFVANKYLFALDISVILRKLQNMNIEVAGLGEQREEELPGNLSGPYWGLLENICKESGWDLSIYAGKKILESTFPIKEEYGGQLLNVWVLSYGDRVVCIYKSVREGFDLAPGIFPVNNHANK